MPDGSNTNAIYCEYDQIELDKMCNGRIVRKIYIKTDSYTIFSVADPAGWLKGEVLRCPDCSIVCADRATLRPQLAPLAVSVARISDVLDAADAKRERTFEIIARAYDMVLQKVDAAANQIHALDLLGDHLSALEQRRDSKNKMKYVVANAVALAAFLSLWAIIAWIVTESSEPDSLAAFLYSHLEGPIGVLTHGLGQPDAQPSFMVMDMLALGAIGAFFSVSMGIRSLTIPHNITTKEMIWTGFARVTVGVIAAAIVIPLIAGKWILGSVSDEYIGWSFLAFGIIAGFSEMFVPNTLKQVETSATVKESPAR